MLIWMGIEYKYICMEEKEMSLTLNMIMPGSSGEDVCFARRMLRVFESCDLAEEGIFDSQTEDYVKSFQKNAGFWPTGKSARCHGACWRRHSRRIIKIGRAHV
jgi:hypothetical protein